MDMLDQVLGKRDAPDQYQDYQSEDEEEDYDCDSDFIDNDSYGEEDRGYKDELRKITGYDPTQYDTRKEMMEDDRLMEVRDYGTLQMEEYISRKKGYEDDEREERLHQKMKKR